MTRILFGKTQDFTSQSNTDFAQSIPLHLLHMLCIATCPFDNVNDKIFSCLVMPDLRKAFDAVSHERLLLKLEHYGIRRTALALLKSYLTNRMQFVNVDGFSSSLKQISARVPQRSILGLQLYIIYI